MLVRPIDYFLATAYVAWDQYRNNPEPTVIKWGFILVTLYMGPLGVLLYVLADKEPRPGEHENFIQALWKQGSAQLFTMNFIMAGMVPVMSVIDAATPDPSLEADHEYEVLLQEWPMREGLTFPAMPMDGAQPNYFTINGRAYPETDTISMRVGETLKVRFIAHPWRSVSGCGGGRQTR